MARSRSRLGRSSGWAVFDCHVVRLGASLLHRLMPGGEPPPRNCSGVSHRRVVLAAVVVLAGAVVTSQGLVPHLQQHLVEGVLAAPGAIQSAAATSGGVMLACLVGALLACTLYNRLAHERTRRRNGVGREIAFLTSLGHRVPGQHPSSDRQSKD